MRAVGFGIGVHVARFVVLWLALLVGPWLGISGWYLGLFATGACVVFALVLVTARGLWTVSGVGVGWRGPVALVALLPLLVEVLLWAVPAGLLDRPPGFVLWAVSLLLVGVNEELVSRVVVLERMREALPAGAAVTVTAALFGLQHLSAFATTSRGAVDILTNVVASASYGFALAAFQLRFHWLWPLVLLHAAADFTTTLSAAPLSDPVVGATLVLFVGLGLLLLRRVRTVQSQGRTPSGPMTSRWSNGPMPPVVKVDGGLVRGTTRDGVDAFLGIPYAAPAVGKDRYRAPRPVVAWEGERDATRVGPTAAQSAYPSPMDLILPSSVSPGDDYLNVNVWAPSQGADGADGAGYPVMVWIHGGAFVRGANSIPTYDGRAFARDGIVLVSVNYRLGVPGFGVLDGAPTNLGLRDQIAALEWVRDNVAAFGGNPDNVTVFGESAGAMSVATLMASPAATGLFHRAVAQSGAAVAVCQIDDARKISEEIAAQLGVPPTAQAFASLDPDRVTAAQGAVALAMQADPDPARWGPSVLRGGLGIMSLFPVVDGEIVPDVPLTRIAAGEASGIPLLVGTTREEFRLFMVPTGVAAGVTPAALPALAARYGWPEAVVETYTANRPGAPAGDIACAVLTDAAFRGPATQLAAAHHAAGGAVYAYEFGWATTVGGLGSGHALELGFVFDTLSLGVAMAGPDAPTPLADDMHRAWVAFGNDGHPGWPAWSPAAPTVMTFDSTSAAGPTPRADELAFWV